MRRITAETYDACATEWESHLRDRFSHCRWNLARYADLEANHQVSQDTDGNDITVGFIVVGANPRGEEYSLMVANHDAAAGLLPLTAVLATLDDVGATIERMVGIDLLRAA
ncbi:hypothetical protein [Herpetosiphon geysericola]|uniref:Uncharacterized protein n=1 Tax=Herpetosiphon geysericola TaxID=70996 RepID=A0A0N8GRV5_9CHLR|nr:hypothetical protein [Herpetosiphon geysericola]KPL87554.1 hypothetical protein SE18_10855 [Herpetosiphon geysericola]